MPKTLKLDFGNDDTTETSLALVRNTLAKGGVIAFPTDTFYGLGADPFNTKAVSKTFQIKNRQKNQPILVLIHDISQLSLFTETINDNAKRLMTAFWPGAVTLLFDAKLSVPKELTGGSDRIGIRLPGSLFARQLIETVGHPLTASSANFSGGKNPAGIDDIPPGLLEQLDLVIDGGELTGNTPSTVVDPSTTPPQVIREGAISQAQIEECFI